MAAAANNQTDERTKKKDEWSGQSVEWFGGVCLFSPFFYALSLTLTIESVTTATQPFGTLED